MNLLAACGDRSTGSSAAERPDCRPKPITVVAFGDSTTAAREGLHAPYPEKLSAAFKAMGIEGEVWNAGHGGDTTDAARSRLASAVLSRKPEIVIIQFGINDSVVDITKPNPTGPAVPMERYIENLAFMVESIKREGGEVILMSPNPLRWTAALRRIYAKAPYDQRDENGFNRDLADYAQAVMKLASDRNTPSLDVFRLFESSNSPASLLLDGMHPNDDGHELITYGLIHRILSVRSLCLIPTSD